MASINSTTDFTGQSSCVTAAVTGFEAAAHDLLDAFNTADPHTQQTILNKFMATPELYGMPVTIGAATLANGVRRMSAATTTASSHAPNDRLNAAANHFDTAAHAVRQALTDADQDTKDAIFEAYLALALPDIDSLGPLFAIAALGIAAKNLHQSDALGLTIEPWGGHLDWSPERLPNHQATATGQQKSTEMTTGNQGGPYLAYYETIQGLPLVVGPFPDHDSASRYLDGPNVNEDLYDRAWVQPITAPDVDALYPRAKLPGQCQASGCDRPGTTRYERDTAVTVLCDECSQILY